MRIAHEASHLDANSPEFAPSPKFVPARDRSASHTLQGDAVLEVDVERSMENNTVPNPLANRGRGESMTAANQGPQREWTEIILPAPGNKKNCNIYSYMKLQHLFGPENFERLIVVGQSNVKKGGKVTSAAGCIDHWYGWYKFKVFMYS